jgi:N-carbamoylputrescine amidase
MRIALVQQHATGDRAENLRRGLDAARRAAAQGANLVAFAELAFSPFYPQTPPSGDVRALAEPVPGPTTEAFAAVAREIGVVCVLNVFERDGEATYDCSPVIDADGRLLGRTRMVHIAEYPCFHEYMRALALGGADLVVVPQAGVVDEWPDGLFEGEMCTAAFQNGYFVALCNRVGQESRLTFAGESFVCGPEGGVRARAPKGEDAILLADVDLADAGRSHGRRTLLRDRRPELYASWLLC